MKPRDETTGNDDTGNESEQDGSILSVEEMNIGNGGWLITVNNDKVDHEGVLLVTANFSTNIEGQLNLSV